MGLNLKLHHYICSILVVVTSHVFLAEASAACPINVSANSTTAVNDGGTASCAVTIDSGVSLTTTGSAVTISGSGSTANNNGTITVNTSGFGIIASGSNVSSITNAGSIYNNGTQASISNTNVLETITNSGSISSADGNGVVNNGTLTSLINSGSIRGGTGVNSAGVYNNTTRTITSITNTGSIQGVYGIKNLHTLVTLNNAQGGNSASASTTALTFTGNLPTNYNIIVNSNTSYGQLSGTSVSGSTVFGIYSGSLLTKGTYTSVLSGLTSGTNVSATSGMYNGTGWRLVLNSGTTWDLLVDSSATNTLAGIQSNSNGLSTVYNQQAAAYQAALSYDCQVYDEAGLCVSVGGRYTYAGPSPSSNQQAGLVIVGYKPVQTFRIGAFADQSVNISTPSGFSQSKSSPMWGFFAKWHMNKDETGLGVQASAVTSSSSLTATRPQLFNTEAGSGTTQFDGQGYQLTTNYHKPVTNNTALVPYLGLRYTRINAGAYTENSTATVTSPLSYNAMAQNTFSAIGGIGVRSHLVEKLTGTASVGIQQNLNYSMGNYAGTSSIMGLETFSVQMPGNVNSMATATAGMFYDINKRERVGVNVLWQQQPFIATNTTTALATYTIGF